MAHVRPAIKPDVLRWARRCRSLTRASAAQKLGVPESKLAAWESGSERPTIGQLRKMAQVYKKPFAILFTDVPPEPLEDLPDLRRLFHVLRNEGAGVPELPPELADAVGEMLARRDVYEEVAVMPPVFHLRIDPSEGIDRFATAVRNALSVDWAIQRTLRSPNKARRFWTGQIEAIGVLVFQFTAPIEQARGFSLAHERYPIVAVNSGDSEFGRVFSLLHELVHVALPEDHSLSPKECEEFCNAVAGRVLVPALLLRNSVPASTDFDTPDAHTSIPELSREFGVSQDVIARRLLDTGRMTKATYENWLQRPQPAPSRQSGGGNYYRTKLTQLGLAYVTTVIAAMEERRLTLAGAARALQVKPLNVEKLRTYLA